jgi:hypothetical protein
LLATTLGVLTTLRVRPSYCLYGCLMGTLMLCLSILAIGLHLLWD